MDEEFEPLLTGGIHDIQLRDIRKTFLIPFVKKDRRNFLIAKFESFLERIKELDLEFEVWIDGSFTTKKEEPNDIDAVFFFNPIEVRKLSVDKYNVLAELFNNPLTKAKYNCDVYYQEDDIFERSRWRGWFGFSRKEKVKGIARICN